VKPKAKHKVKQTAKQTAKHSIQIKTGLFLASILLIAVTALSAFVLMGIRSYQQQEFERALIGRGEIANDYIKQTYLMESIVDPDVFIHTRAEALVKRFDLISGLRVVLYDMQGNVVSDSRAYLPDVNVDAMMTYALEGKNTYIQRDASIYFLTPLSNTSRQIGVLRFDDDVTAMDAFYQLMTRRLILMAGIVFVFTFIGAAAFSRPLTKGLVQLTASAAAIESGRMEAVKRIRRRDELGALSDAIWEMGETIHSQMEALKDERGKLRNAVEDLETMGQHQKRFIGNVTHEFRTPLTVIKAYADLIQMYESDLSLHGEAAEHIQREVKRLSEMVNRVLTLTVMDNYQEAFHMEALDLSKCLEGAFQQMAGKAMRHGLTLEKSLESAIAYADTEAVMQIAINLIDNAIKYNRPKGLIKVSCFETEQWAVFEVEDTGIGIPIADREAVFEPFYRVDISRAGGIDSSGLGLALVKTLVTKQHGQIAIQNGEDGGTRIMVQLPKP
jgi:signal transduction histidine kinase